MGLGGFTPDNVRSDAEINQLIADALSDFSTSLSRVRSSDLLVVPTTFFDDTELNFPVEANKTYLIMMFVNSQYASGNGLTLGASFPSGTIFMLGSGNMGAFAKQPIFSIPYWNLLSDVNEKHYVGSGFIKVGGTGGLFSIQWKQQATGSGSYVKRGTGIFVIGSD